MIMFSRRFSMWSFFLAHVVNAPSEKYLLHLLVLVVLHIVRTANTFQSLKIADWKYRKSCIQKRRQLHLLPYESMSSFCVLLFYFIFYFEPFIIFASVDTVCFLFLFLCSNKKKKHSSSSSTSSSTGSSTDSSSSSSE